MTRPHALHRIIAAAFIALAARAGAQPTESVYTSTTTIATTSSTSSSTTLVVPPVTTTTVSMPTGPTTTSTTRAPSPTTTSTSLPPVDCDTVEPGSLAAFLCRLAVLDTEIDRANGLGPFRQKLQSTLARAIDRAQEAVAACAAGDTKTAARRMKQTAKFLQKMSHRLAGLSARKKLDPTLRAGIIQVIDSIRGDANALRRRPCDEA